MNTDVMIEVTPTFLALVAAGAVFVDTVVICGMAIGNLQFICCVIILLGAMMLMGVVTCPVCLRDLFIATNASQLVLNVLNEYRDLGRAVLDMWYIMLQPASNECALNVLQCC